MQFQTPVPVTKSELTINHSTPIVSIGSCFSENIGNKLEERLFRIENNPFGVIFNPISIIEFFERAISNTLFVETDLLKKDDVFVCWNANSSVWKENQVELLKTLNRKLEQIQLALKSKATFVTTFGSAWVYERIETGKAVANCHKVPNNQFTKRLLSVAEIIDRFNLVLEQHSSCNFIFTVSPVRHLKDGFVENQQSKATLVLATKTLVDNNKNCDYFPSYEIVLDELRDYRFYKQDMLHPTEQAIGYVWDKFLQTYFSETTQKLMLQIEKLQLSAGHKPFQPSSKSHQKFLANQLQTVEQLAKEFPTINFEAIKSRLENNFNFESL